MMMMIMMATQDHMTDLGCTRDVRQNTNIYFNVYFFTSGVFCYYLEKRPF